MNLVLALVIAILFGAGITLTLKEDLLRVIIGIIMISNAGNLFIIAAGQARGAAPIYPLPVNTIISDPLVQALVLTAIVISFAFSLLALALVYRFFRTHQALDQVKIASEEEAERDELQSRAREV